ncbi:MAG: glutamate formimidoyltransferase [Herpetosiphon sp.]
MAALVECVPNFSEGRRADVIAAIVDAIRAVPAVLLLDIHADHDHNRSVVTFAGPPNAVAEAAFRATALAARLISLDDHHGVHPRIGATDVLPFVPLRDCSLADCVELARVVGRRIAEEQSIPVYLYEAAATRSERQHLEHIRRGGYERLRETITFDPAVAPDYGPHRLTSAGATAVGARQPLIAYNVYLNTADPAIARAVARAIRFSNGGLRAVKALGLLVGGRAQVSINLVDYHQTPLSRVFDLIVAEAARFGVVPVESEVVGLIPEDALLDVARATLRLHRFHPEQLLERRLAAAEQQQSSAERPIPRPPFEIGAGHGSP